MSKYAEIQAKISELQKQADQVYASEKKSVIADIKEKIKIYGLTAADLGLAKKSESGKSSAPKSSSKTSAKSKSKSKASKSKKAAPQFVGPNGETWSGGRGKRPAWVNEILAAGGDIERYRVK